MPPKATGGLPTEEKVSNPSSKESPEKPAKNLSLQQSFKVFDNIIKGKTQEKGVPPSVETRRILNKTETFDLGSGGLKSGRGKLSMLDEVEDVDIDDLNNYSQTQKSDLERKFKHITSNNVMIKEKPSGAQTSKNLFSKLKKFFV